MEAIPKDPEMLGAEWGLPRRPGEGKERYMTRLRGALGHSLRRGTAYGIREAIETVLHASVVVEVLEYPSQDAVQVVLREPRWRRWLWFPARADKRQAERVLASELPAGIDSFVSFELVPMYLRSPKHPMCRCAMPGDNDL